MEKAEVLEAIKNIGTCEDEVERRNLLASLTDEVTKVFDENDTLTSKNKELDEKNKKLYEANMDLFTRIPVDKDANTRLKDETGVKNEGTEKRKFEDLFDEKGGIK